jgi:thioredoxin 1
MANRAPDSKRFQIGLALAHGLSKKEKSMAGNGLTEFTDQNFEEQVLKSDKPVLVDFWATWCGPCRAIAPAVEAVAQQYADRAKVGKVNVDENMSVTSRYRITGIPALLLFKNGQVAEQLMGVQSKETLIKMLDRHIG